MDAFRRCLRSVAVLFAGLAGCTHTWDDVTSRDFKMAQLWTPAPSPLETAASSTDGYKRARALVKLSDPGRDSALRDQHLAALQKAAQTDRDPLCRMAALRTLGGYKDSRASAILSEVYLGNPGMSAENNALIRQQALAALEQNGPPEAKQTFMRAAKQPGGGLTTAAYRDRVEILDERLLAVRALGKFKDRDAVETLVSLLETEKDVALRACAQEALRASTGRNIPADGKAWREYLATGREPARPSLFATPTKNSPPPKAEPREGPIQLISNWMRGDRAPGETVNAPSTPPQATLSPPTRAATPSPTFPAGTVRNAQGELVVPVQP